MPHKSLSESETFETNKNAFAVTRAQLKVGQDNHGFWGGITKGINWRISYLGSGRQAD